jgi:hypothetical protein
MVDHKTSEVTHGVLPLGHGAPKSQISPVTLPAAVKGRTAKAEGDARMTASIFTFPLLRRRHCKPTGAVRVDRPGILSMLLKVSWFVAGVSLYVLAGVLGSI